MEAKLFGESFLVSNDDFREEKNHFAMGSHHVSMTGPSKETVHAVPDTFTAESVALAKHEPTSEACFVTLVTDPVSERGNHDPLLAFAVHRFEGMSGGPSS